jgi:hypothetical protein
LVSVGVMLFATKPRQVGVPRDVLALIAVCVLMGFALVVTWSNLPDDNDRHFQLKLGAPGVSDPSRVPCIVGTLTSAHAPCGWQLERQPEAGRLPRQQAPLRRGI